MVYLFTRQIKFPLGSSPRQEPRRVGEQKSVGH